LSDSDRDHDGIIRKLLDSIFN